jgi:hypothetical protein
MTEGIVTIAHEDRVTLPTSTRMMVDIGDWARVRRNVEKLGEPLLDRASNIGAIFIGAAIALVGIIASIESGTTQPAGGLLTGLWVAFAFCAVVAVLLFVMGTTEKRRYRVVNRAICDDMDDIASKGGHPDLGAAPPKVAVGIRGRIARVWSGDVGRDAKPTPQA